MVQRGGELVLAFATVELELFICTNRDLMWLHVVLGAPTCYLVFVVEIRELQSSLPLHIAVLCNCSGGFSLHIRSRARSMEYDLYISSSGRSVLHIMITEL